MSDRSARGTFGPAYAAEHDILANANVESTMAETIVSSRVVFMAPSNNNVGDLWGVPSVNLLRHFGISVLTGRIAPGVLQVSAQRCEASLSMGRGRRFEGSNRSGSGPLMRGTKADESPAWGAGLSNGRFNRRLR